MATKTISIELDVYERLKALRTTPAESFSKVLRRSVPEKIGASAGEILAMIQAGTYPQVGWTDEEIDVIEHLDDTFVSERVGRI